jgi:hypothetical protein
MGSGGAAQENAMYLDTERSMTMVHGILIVEVYS